jgi:hypothetical protein
MRSQLAERQKLAALPHGRGRGPGGHPTGLALPVDRCPVPGCDEQIDRTRLMCRRDWYQVPRRLRDRAWRTWRSGHEAAGRDHREAVIAAIAAARLSRLPAWRRPLVRLRLMINPAHALGLSGRPRPRPGPGH